MRLLGAALLNALVPEPFPGWNSWRNEKLPGRRLSAKPGIDLVHFALVHVTAGTGSRAPGIAARPAGAD